MQLYRHEGASALRSSGRRSPSGCRAVIVLATVLLIGSVSGHSYGADGDAPSYRFGPGDKLRITVLDHPDLSGEFTINQSGSISLPTVGRIHVAGLEFNDLEDGIATRLGESGLVKPQVSLDVAEYRPVYVIGDVKTPGRYPFATGMTVLQAVAMGGGLRTISDETVGFRLELARAREAIDTLEIDYLAAVARRARLLAERDGLDGISFPPAIVERQVDSRVADMMDGETRLFATRRAAIVGAVAILEKQKDELREEMSSQAGQLESLERRNEIIETEMHDIGYLFGKGLATKTRLLELQRLQSEVQSNRIALAAFVSRARQEVSKVTLSIANLRNERLDSVVADLAGVEQEISKLEVRRRAAKEVTALLEMPSIQPMVRLAVSGDSFVITRDRGKGPEDMTATDHSYVLPGDVVRVLRFEIQQSPIALGDALRDLASSGGDDPATSTGR
jgi:protein involved in polysaccharide export with SLBB domain